MKLTFGKFNGFTTTELAQSGQRGRQYLQWLTENARQRDLRKAADTALALDEFDYNVSMRVHLRIEGSDERADERARIAADWEKEAHEAKREAKAAQEVLQNRLIKKMIDSGINPKGAAWVVQVLSQATTPKLELEAAISQKQIKMSAEKMAIVSAIADQYEAEYKPLW